LKQRYSSRGGASRPPGLKGRLSLARGALFWERLWPALWPVFGVVGGFLAVAAARRRLEVDSGLAHRPLFALDDKLATDPRDRAGAALWEAHRLRLAWPRPGLVRLDPLALRVLVVLFLAAGVAAGKDDWAGRLIGAVTPRLAMAQPGLPASLSVWINPPAYTGQPPLYLEPTVGEEGEEGEVAAIPVPWRCPASPSAPRSRTSKKSRPTPIG
jgi:hypothetical protein